MLIRSEEESDRAAVRAVHLSAFDTPAEADLVDALRMHARLLVSLVAEMKGAIVGHILFSPVSLSGYPERRIMGLAPMAVEPDSQRTGVGSALVRTGLDRCRHTGWGAVVVLGHPDYYPRFGFACSVRFGIRCEYDAAEEAFMALELEPGYLAGASGVIKYHAAFRDV